MLPPLLPPLLLLACATAPTDTPDTGADAADTASDSASDTGDSSDVGPAEFVFRYVIIADPHVTTPDGDARARLDRAVAWVNDNAEELDLELVLVVGDIAWGDGLDAARDSLDALAVTYVPINGDNEVSLGSEEAYAQTFAERYEELATTLPEWEKAPVEVYNPIEERPSWFHNLAFTWRGIRFVGLDWCSRDTSGLISEFGELHDFEGGTWPFFVDQLGRVSAAGEHVALFSHIPMHFGMFDIAEMERITGVTEPLGAQVWADLAGHYHASASETVPDSGYDLHVTDATWDDEIELRLVEVWQAGEDFVPVTELVVVP